MKAIILALVVLSVLMWVGNTASANSVASSTMWFQGALNGGLGVLNMIDESAMGVGDGIAGFDIYARNGATAWFGDVVSGVPVWTSVDIAGHDAWSSWNPDTPDWYQYSVDFYMDGDVTRWALRNHAGATAQNPHSTLARGVPMSGLMDWTMGRATESDIGAYLPGTGTPEISGGAAAHGGGAACWDMDWSWGSEAVPLQYGEFRVTVMELGGDQVRVSMAPVPEPTAYLLLGVGLGAIALIRWRKKA